MDGRVIREGFGMIMTLVLDRLDLRCLWGYPSGDVEQASGCTSLELRGVVWAKIQMMVKVMEVEEEALSECVE